MQGAGHLPRALLCDVFGGDARARAGRSADIGFASEHFTAVAAVRACAVIAMVLMVLFAFLFSISKAEETVGPD